MTTTNEAVKMAQASLDRFFSKDMKAWSELCADNVLVEFPFAPEGSPSRLEGKKAIYEYLKDYPNLIDIQEITSSKIYGTDDPETAVIDWSVRGLVIGNGNPYVMSYSTYIKVRGGLIIGYKEYWNPLVFLKALGVGPFAAI